MEAYQDLARNGVHFVMHTTHLARAHHYKEAASPRIEVLWVSSPRPRTCTPKPLSPNKSLQRSVMHKVLGRGRPSAERTRALRARVLRGRRAAAELNR
jgi:hypothetical protein